MNKYLRAREKAKKGIFESVITNLEKPSRTKHYDGSSPKFVYRRKVGSVTRKSNKVPSGSELILNQSSKPSSQRRGYSEYPASKPMIGWERVYVGNGKWLARGRRKKHMRANLSKEIILKPQKPRFVPFARTYSNNLNRQYNVLNKDEYKKEVAKHSGRKIIRK